jgi:hypothetical protein
MVVDLCARHKERRPGKDLGRAAGSKPAARVSVGHDECVAHASSSPCVAHNPRVEYDTATHSHSPPWQAPSPPPTRTNISPAERQAFVARHACGGCGAVGLWGCLKKFLVVGMQLVRTVRWGRGGTGQAQAPSDRIQDTGASWSARKEAADGRRLVSGNAELWVDGVGSIN